MSDDNMALRSKIDDLAEDIMSEVQHGECFYEKEMFDSFIRKVECLKKTATAYYRSNQEENGD